MNIETRLAEIQSVIDGLQLKKQWLLNNRTKIEELDLQEKVSFGYGSRSIDFDYLAHDKVVEVVRTFGGKWAKTPSGDNGKIDYETALDGVTIRCWAGEPPPSCKIVEVEEDVPAQPASKRIVRKMVCKETEVAA